MNYNAATRGKPAGVTSLRHLVFCFSEDICGLCEVGKFKKWESQVAGVVNRKVCTFQRRIIIIYPNFRKQARFPGEKKSIMDNLELSHKIASEDRISVRQQLSKESGYTGLSILHRLYYLYGFLYDRDLVFYEMPTVHLNLVKNALKNLKEDDS